MHLCKTSTIVCISCLLYLFAQCSAWCAGAEESRVVLNALEEMRQSMKKELPRKGVEQPNNSDFIVSNKKSGSVFSLDAFNTFSSSNQAESFRAHGIPVCVEKLEKKIAAKDFNPIEPPVNLLPCREAILQPIRGDTPARGALPGTKDSIAYMEVHKHHEVQLAYELSERSRARLALNQQDETDPLYTPLQQGHDLAASGIFVDFALEKNLQLSLGAEYRINEHENTMQALPFDDPEAMVGLEWKF